MKRKLLLTIALALGMQSVSFAHAPVKYERHHESTFIPYRLPKFTIPTFDFRTSIIINTTCPKCNSENTTMTIINNEMWGVCNNCHAMWHLVVITP